MSELAAQQRALLSLLKGRPAGSNGSSESRPAPALTAHVELVREIILWWREFGITRYCPFTVAILRRRGDFASVLAAFVRASPGSPMIERQGDLFLEHVSRDADPLVGAVAATERALIRSQLEPERGLETIRWRHDPEAVFAFLLNGAPFCDEDVTGSYTVRVAPTEPRIDW